MDQVDNKLTVRSLFRAVSIPELEKPYNVAQLKIFYPAIFNNTDTERNTGLLAAKETSEPYPVVVMMPGINLGPEAYQWLAILLAENNIITVSYQLVAEEMPGYIGITPGLDLNFIRPDTYGTKPSGNSIKPIIEELRRLQSSGPLAGKLDLNKIVLGGHSAGGTAALLNANPDWFPELAGVFAYAAHSGASTALGFEDNTTLNINNKLPILLLGGTEDGCIAQSQQRYGVSLQGDFINSATARIEQTFNQSIVGGQADKHLLIIDGANHFSIAHPIDTSAGRHFIDKPTTKPDVEIRTVLSELILSFIEQFVRSPSANKQTFENAVQRHQALIALHRSK